MWLEEEETEDSMVHAMSQEPGCGGGRGDRELYGGHNVSGARIWLEVGKPEDCMMDAMYRSQDGAGSRGNRGQYGGGNV